MSLAQTMRSFREKNKVMHSCRGDLTVVGPIDGKFMKKSKQYDNQ